MAKPSPYFKERIITHRAKKISYEKIRLELQKENFKVSKISIGKICRSFKMNSLLLIISLLVDILFTRKKLL
jgi:hypothetical protein